MDITRTSGKRVNAGQGELVTAGGNQTTVRKSWKTLAAVVLGLVLSVPELSQARYVFTDIDVPDATSTAANGYRTHEIAGESTLVRDRQLTHGFVLNKGVFTTIDKPSAFSTVVSPVLTIFTTQRDQRARPVHWNLRRRHYASRLCLGKVRLHHAQARRVERIRIAKRLLQRAGRGPGRLQGRHPQIHAFI